MLVLNACNMSKNFNGQENDHKLMIIFTAKSRKQTGLRVDIVLSVNSEEKNDRMSKLFF